MRTLLSLEIVGYIKKKIEKYQDLKREIRRMLSVKSVDVVQVVVGAFVSITKKLGQRIEKLGIRVRIGCCRKLRYWERPQL